MRRRTFSLGLGAVAGSLLTSAASTAFAADRAPGAPGGPSVEEALQRIEAGSGGRLGVAMLDTATGRRIAHRADERFPMCSTFKFLAAALVLHRVDGGEESLQRPIDIDAASIVTYSPATGSQVGRRMTMAQLCEAAVTLSDNTAANLMLQSFGGPDGLTRYVRSLGDGTTRLDRIETTLNEALPGDPRDTTSPTAMLGLMRQLLLGDGLSTASRRQLRDWMRANTTGAENLRARLPDGWRVGDKTGAGGHGTRNDIGIVWPPDGRAPLLVAAYLTGATSLDDAAQRRVIAGVGALLPEFAAAA